MGKLLKYFDYLASGIITIFIISSWYLFFTSNLPTEEVKFQLIWVLSLMSIAITIIFIAIMRNEKGKNFNIPISSLIIKLCMSSSILFLIDISNDLVELTKSIYSQYTCYIISGKNLIVILSVFISLRSGEIFKIK